MTRIMFVCHGNICRSPMAEFIFKKLLSDRGVADRFSVASSATSREEIWNGVGNPVYPPARRELQKHGIRCDGHAAHQITRAELNSYDHIYYMDRSNARYLRSMFGSKADKCRPLLSRDVADPWYTGDFSQTWDDILDGCQRILEELI